MNTTLVRGNSASDRSLKEASMLAVTFVIFGIRANGTEVELFRWCRDEASGLARAASDAKAFGMAFDSFEARAA